MYNEGIIDFRPLGNETTADKNNTKKGLPSLKIEPNVSIKFHHTGTWYTQEPCAKGVDGCGYYYRGIAYSGQIKQMLYLLYQGHSATKGFDPKLLKAVDEKMDDGWYSTGIVRGGCYGGNVAGFNSYDNAIKNGGNCWILFYAI